ncbi:MAG: competence protein ComK [Bacilli bacterium]|nr:competence protein ComK [Bacilli bacterium]
MSYLINDKTLALIPSKNKTKVIEFYHTITVNTEVKEIIARNCEMNGSSLEGRQKGSSYLIGTSYKPPIILSEKDNLILVPTHSNRNHLCSWIILSNLLNYYPYSAKSVLIEFQNNQKIVLNISYSVFDNQILRATRLESSLRGRKNKKYL